MIKPGDIVEVTNALNQFSSYKTFFKEQGIEHLMDRWHGGCCFHSMVAQVLYILPHSHPSDYLDGVAVIEDLHTNDIHLIYPKGLKKCDNYLKPEDILSVLAI